MPEVPAYDGSGARRDAVALPDDWFAERVSRGTLYQAVRAYQANQRQGTASTLTRSQVQGSGAKPWRQKGTGRARAGTRTSPIWTGGGVVFGPHPRDHRQRLPRGLRKLALRSAFRQKLDAGALFVVSLEPLERPRTSHLARTLRSVLEAAENGGRRVLLLTGAYDENLVLSARNIPNLAVKAFKDVTAYEVLLHSVVLIEAGVAGEGGAAGQGGAAGEGGAAGTDASAPEHERVPEAGGAGAEGREGREG